MESELCPTVNPEHCVKNGRRGIVRLRNVCKMVKCCSSFITLKSVMFNPKISEL